jgi:hypothetical protein
MPESPMMPTGWLQVRAAYEMRVHRLNCAMCRATVRSSFVLGLVFRERGEIRWPSDARKAPLHRATARV